MKDQITLQQRLLRYVWPALAEYWRSRLTTAANISVRDASAGERDHTAIEADSRLRWWF